MMLIGTLLLAASLAAAPARAVGSVLPPAQAPESAGVTSIPAVQAPETASVISAPVPPPASSGLPQRAPVAQTMAAHWPVFAAFVLLWLVIVAYTLSFGKRSEQLAKELERLDAEARNTSG